MHIHLSLLTLSGIVVFQVYHSMQMRHTDKCKADGNFISVSELER